MVWQAERVGFWQFFALFLPALVNWLVPATLMSLAVESGRPLVAPEKVVLRPGSLMVVVLFLGTVGLAVYMHAGLHLPPVLGMMTGLGVLNLYGSHLRRRARTSQEAPGFGDEMPEGLEAVSGNARAVPVDPQEYFDIFKILERAEWDTLFFFYGVIMCVGALGPTVANILVGVMSAVVDNIPVMVAVLKMNPDMSLGQWLLVTLTAGVGGSLSSIGSAAGVALMGHARGHYTFLTHLRWTWAVGLGYAASIWVHMLLNRGVF